MAVLDGKFLVGKVVEVNYSTSRVLLLSDLNSKIPVSIEPNGIQSILSGSGSSFGEIQYIKEDYGQTLGVWGIGPGCYIVLPVLGPSTLRDTAGSFANIMGGDPWYNASVQGNNEFLTEKVYLTSKALSGINFRADNIKAIDNLEKNSMDFYASVKSLYTQDRENKIRNNQRGNIEVLYKDEEDWEEIDSQ